MLGSSRVAHHKLLAVVGGQRKGRQLLYAAQSTPKQSTLAALIKTRHNRKYFWIK
jgi:hypothetical protein